MKVEMNPSGVNGLPTFDTTVVYAGREVLIKNVRAMYSIGSVVNIKFNPFDVSFCYICD